jgi:WD40 repeat protein
VAGHFNCPVSGLKLKVLDNSTIVLVVSGEVTPSGDLHIPANNLAKHSTGRLYTSLPVRQCDSYVTEIRNAIFYGSLKKIDGLFKLDPIPLRNILKGLQGFECPLQPFGDSSQYDINKNGIAFISKSPEPNSATLPASNVYLISISSSEQEPLSPPKEIKVPGLNGASSSLVFSPDGKSLAFLKMKEADYESDKNRIIVIPDISKFEVVQELFVSDDGQGSWDRSAGSITWSNDGKKLFVTAGERGRVKLFKT